MPAAKLDAYGLLHATGEDARAFLHAQLTSDIAGLPAGRARLAGWCSAKGRLLASFLVVPFSGGYLLQLSRDLVPAVARRLAMFILRAKVKLVDAGADWAQLGLWGGDAAAQLSQLGLTVPQEDFAAAEADGAVVVRLSPERFLLLARQAVANRLGAAAASGDWALAEVRAGRPRIAQATQEQFVPQMVNLERVGGVDFRKGCYPGQEVVARAQYRGAVKRRMYRVRGAGLQEGQELFSDEFPDQPSGTVVNAAGGEALAVLPVSSVEAGQPVRPAPGAPALEILPLPYAG